MTNKYVLDASAILAFLKDEIGADVVASVLPNSVISTVNLSEVCSKLIDYGLPHDEIAQVLAEFVPIIQPFDLNQALKAGHLRAMARRKGLSLGDRACLALAGTTGRIALTADRIWSELDLDISIELIR